MPLSNPQANLAIKKHFPVSESSFKELVRKEQDDYIYYFVDKTLFIRAILENPRRVSLITRPRRFGKSINFNMLSWFLDVRKKEESKELFSGLKIEKAKLSNGEPCMDYRGKYPVIYMNFKTLGENSYREFYGMFKDLISDLYLQHDYLLEGDILKKSEKSSFEKIIDNEANGSAYKKSLKKLLSYLHRHFGERVFVLIDEYDAPFQQAIHQRLKSAKFSQSQTTPQKQADYLDSLKTLMGTFLGDALKDDESLETCVMTGIIRIAGAGIFSQLNNVDVWTVLDEPFSEYFGFTQEELDQLLTETGKISESAQFAEWYNGYEFGGKIIYNPLSVIKSLDRNKFANYWLDTSNNMLIHDSLLKPRQESDKQIINEAVASWLSGQAVEKSVDEQLVFDGNLNTLEHLWILLISSGYLKVVAKNPEPGNFLCSLQIPNKEVLHLYQKVFVGWLYTFGVTGESSMIQHLLSGQAEDFCLELQKFFLETISVRDGFTGTSKQNEAERYEAFYHGFMAATLGLSLSKAHAVLRSNREGGHGYYDLMLSPRDPHDVIYNKAIILEFKRAETNENIGKAADKSFEQIIKKAYYTNIVERGVKDVVFIALAFYGKHLEFKHETMSVNRLKIKKFSEGGTGSDGVFLSD